MDQTVDNNLAQHSGKNGPILYGDGYAHCNNCRKRRVLCDMDPEKGYGCTRCLRAEREMRRPVVCQASSDIPLRQRPTNLQEVAALRLRRACDKCTRSRQARCCWMEDRESQAYACQFCNADGFVCRWNKAEMPLRPGTMRATPKKETERIYGPVTSTARRCTLCKVLRDRTCGALAEGRACDRCLAWGLDCELLPGSSGPNSPGQWFPHNDPAMAGTGLYTKLVYKRCEKCAERGLVTCDRATPCFHCREAGLICVRKKGIESSNTILHDLGLRLGMDRPLYWLSLGFGPGGPNSVRPPNRPDIPGPPRPFVTPLQRWPRVLLPRRNGAPFQPMAGKAYDADDQSVGQTSDVTIAAGTSLGESSQGGSSLGGLWSGQPPFVEAPSAGTADVPDPKSPIEPEFVYPPALNPITEAAAECDYLPDFTEVCAGFGPTPCADQLTVSGFEEPVADFEFWPDTRNHFAQRDKQLMRQLLSVLDRTASLVTKSSHLAPPFASYLHQGVLFFGLWLNFGGRAFLNRTAPQDGELDLIIGLWLLSCYRIDSGPLVGSALQYYDPYLRTGVEFIFDWCNKSIAAVKNSAAGDALLRALDAALINEPAELIRAVILIYLSNFTPAALRIQQAVRVRESDAKQQEWLTAILGADSSTQPRNCIPPGTDLNLGRFSMLYQLTSLVPRLERPGHPFTTLQGPRIWVVPQTSVDEPVFYLPEGDPERGERDDIGKYKGPYPGDFVVLRSIPQLAELYRALKTMTTTGTATTETVPTSRTTTATAATAMHHHYSQLAPASAATTGSVYLCEETMRIFPNNRQCGAPAFAPESICEDVTHVAPFFTCDIHKRTGCFHLLRHPYSRLTHEDVVAARAFPCSACLDAGLVGTIRAIRPAWYSAKGNGWGSGCDRVTPWFGCSCWKMLQASLCLGHRLAHAEAWVNQVWRMTEWIASTYGRRVCPACCVNVGVDAYNFRGPKGGANHRVVTWVCLACQEWVVVPRELARELLPGLEVQLPELAPEANLPYEPWEDDEDDGETGVEQGRGGR